jgi:hypothetical protein
VKKTAVFQNGSLVRTAVMGLAMVAGLWPQTPAAAAATEAFTAYSAGHGSVVISRGSEDHLRLNVIAWGPKWAWTGLDGTTRSEQGAAVAALSAKMGGTGVPFRVAFRGRRTAPQQLQFQYAAQAEADTELTYVVVELAPGRTFHGRDAIVESGGQTTKVRCPFERRGLGSAVETVRLTDAGGATTVLRFDPACEIGSDGPARVVLAKDKLSAGAAQRLQITIDLPGSLSWYPSVEDVPDEPGAETWYRWQATGDTGDSAIGLQDWLEKPAGQYGRIMRSEDKLLYRGKPIKLWGLNLCYGTCAPEKSLAERRAAFYRKYGINAVRLHKYADGPGWAGIQSENSCVAFDPDALDRMDYQVAKFKEAGIYVKLSAHFGTLKLGPDDKQYVPFAAEFGTARRGGARIETPHSAVHYSPDLQRVHILQTVNLLQHKNPYTGLTYAEDPVIAFVEIINEQSILFYSSMAPLKASPTVRKQVGERFCQWLRKKYGSQQKLEEGWGGRPAFDSFANEGFRTDGEQLDRGNILPLGNPWFWDPDQLNGSQAFRKQRLLDTLQFLYGLQCEFFDRYVRAVRDAGYQGEILSSNWQAGRALSHFANLHSDALTGTVDRHNYFGAGRANASMLHRAGSGMLSSGMQQVADRPFMLSEWIHVFPNELGVEGPAILGAYGMGLQGWDASFMFQNRDNGAFSEKIGRDQWDVTAPQVLGVFPAVARHIHRGDVLESPTAAVRRVHMPSLFAGKLGFDDSVAQGYDDKELDSSTVSARSLAVTRSAVAFTDEYADTPAFDLKAHARNGQLVSSTSQLRWQEATAQTGGFFTLDTPGTKGVVGFAAGRKLELDGVTIEPQTPFAAIYVTARDRGQTIASARELLIVAIARARNTGMKFSPNGDRMLAPGKPPIVMEPVKARLTIRKPGATRVILLDHDGRITDKQIPLENGACHLDGARDQTPYYLVSEK